MDGVIRTERQLDGSFSTLVIDFKASIIDVSCQCHEKASSVG